MNDGHAAVTELLGAWALDACSAEETATVEDHLAGCPSKYARRMASRCAAGRSSTAALTDLATELATAVSSGSGTAIGGAASAVWRRRAAERRTQSTARRRVMVPSQLRHVPRAGSNACGFSHTRTNTSWVMSSAAAQSRVTRAASPYTRGDSSSYNSPSAASSPATRRSQTSLSHRGCEDCSCSTQAAPLGSGQVIGPHSFLIGANATVKG